MKIQSCSKTVIAWLCSVALLSAADPAKLGNLLPTGNFEPAKDIATSWSKDCRVFHNIAVASPGKTVHRNRRRQNKPEPSNVWEANVLFADGTKKLIAFSKRDTWADPLPIAPAPDAPPPSFGLIPGSPGPLESATAARSKVVSPK